MGMTNRERVKAILHYQPVDRVPVVAFGYWNETLESGRGKGILRRRSAMDITTIRLRTTKSCKNWALISTGILAWAEM